MDSCFIKNNENEILKKVQNINKNKDDILGQLKLITIISGKDYRERTVRCIEKESVYYIKNIVEVSNIRSQLHKAISFRDMFNYNSKINVYEGTWNDHKLISFYADRVDKIKIKKTNKKNFYCISKQDFCLNGQELHKDKIYKVEFEEFQRSSNWIEYIAMKNQFPDSVDKTKKLVDLFDKIIEKN